MTLDRFGMEDSAYSFDGQSNYLIADIENRIGDFSLSLWAKAANTEQSRYRSVINIHDKTPGSKDTCQIHTSGGRYPTYQFFSSNPESFALVTQEWQHLAVTVLGNVIRFYENGERVTRRNSKVVMLIHSQTLLSERTAMDKENTMEI